MKHSIDLGYSNTNWFSQFKARYLEINQAATISMTQQVAKKGKVNGLKRLIREVLSDSNDNTPAILVCSSNADPSKPWRAEFRSYLETVEACLPTGITTIQWWGVCTFQIIFDLVAYNINLSQINAQ
jgi:hypothetical protein